jgi:subtilisin-like proprotein convertase family protein
MLRNSTFFLSLFLILSQLTWAQKWEDRVFEPNNVSYRFKTVQAHIAAVDMDELRLVLDNSASRNVAVMIALPMPDGESKMFEFAYDPIFPPSFQEKFPSIKTFTVKSGRYHGRADINQHGLHVMMYSPEGTILIDPAIEGNSSLHMSYYVKDLSPEAQRPFSCETDADLSVYDRWGNLNKSLEIKPQMMGMRSSGEPVKIRAYRTAVSTTGEYTRFHGGTVEGAMAAIVTTINRVNVVYLAEHSVRLNLIENNDRLIFLDPDTDPFTNNSLSNMLNENRETINSIIGVNNYDVGHVFGTAGGGLAQLGSVCNLNGKARGGTGLPQPRGDFFDVVYVGHEFGHQFAAAHTFNNCDGNESPGTAFEPGSGTTIMAYAGLCGSNNVTTSTDFYFHNASLVQVRNFIETGGGSTCGLVLDTENTHPRVNIQARQNLAIPISTPFELFATAEDNEDSNLVMNWEQWDLGPQSVLGSPIGTAPLFRSQIPESTGRRVLPIMSRVLNGTSSNQEILPTTTRPITFRVSVRDNHPGSGGASWAQLNMTATAEAGPFRILAPVVQEQIRTGSFYEIKWDVANTDKAPVSCEFVDILISRNGGLVFSDTLLRRVPNTGSVMAVMPFQPGNSMRIKIAGHDHVFFQVNPGNFRLIEPDTATFSFIPEVPRNLICTPGTVEIPIETRAIRNYTGDVRFEINPIDVPENISFNFNNASLPIGESEVLTIDMEAFRGFGQMDFEIWGISDELGDTLIFPISLQLSNFLDTAPIGLSPDKGQLGTSAPIRFTWSEVPGALTYNFKLGTYDGFPSLNQFVREGIRDTFLNAPVLFEINTVYFWTIEAVNLCGSIEEELLGSFQTELLNCTTYTKTETTTISPSGTPTIFSEIEVDRDATILSVEVLDIEGNHQSFNDMDFWLFSPSDESIRLLGRSCSNFGGAFDMSFSDLAASGFSCPPNQGLTYRPVTPLNTFVGTNALGTWRLRIRDVVAGAGGQFRGWKLNICDAAPASVPVLINNEILVLRPDGPRHLNSSLLLVEDNIKNASEIVYTIVKSPSKGVLSIQDVPLAVGTTFTQEDINNGRILYAPNVSSDDEDHFDFIVRHDQGGFIGVTRFQINVDESFVSSTQTVGLVDADIRIFPNPTQQSLFIVDDSGWGIETLAVHHVSGKRMTYIVGGQHISMQSLSTNNWPAGVYLVTVQNKAGIITKSIIKQ